MENFEFLLIIDSFNDNFGLLSFLLRKDLSLAAQQEAT